MPLRAKLILLTLLPLILVTASISWISIHQTKALGVKEIETLRTSLIRSRENALKDKLDLAFDAIHHVYANDELSEEDAKHQVKQILTRLRYGSDGYFFAYDKNGVNLVHPILPELIGQNLINMQDENGNFLIVSLIEQARSGGGFAHYLWQKPSTGEIVPKLSYAAWLPKWEWMVGTGLYIEDIHLEVAQMEDSINQNIEATFISTMSILSVTVAVIVVLTLAVNWHEHRIADKNLKELAHKTVMFQEDEKKHLARELHDGINQLLVSCKCHLELLAHKLKQKEPNIDERALAHLDKSQMSMMTAINEVRRISHNLRPSSLDDIGLQAALETLLQDFREHAQIPVEYEIDKSMSKMNSEVATTLYRVVQESLTNIEKHAYANRVEVVVHQLGEQVQLMIRDDGRGFSVSDTMRAKGIGLRNMRERVEFIGGDFELFSEPNYGTEITVLIPV
ncbi:cache domain-containing protein [Vibrio sp. SCSIO 43132]|uniref:cache domain-containing protein n=1 Tax=Vibrio sp. SCSIO 43132 TaxID=2779363 RepID=UPI001CA895F1|nr:cache domain-containing protein [Vibrio sp. SCSIO 43132]UAB69046.1 cache domain-containing protein [Vibrio sp. SCSIO 43132]